MSEALPVKNIIRGWHLVFAHTRSHYYVDGQSLCGRLHVSDGALLFNEMHTSGFNCAMCAKKRDRLFPNEV